MGGGGVLASRTKLTEAKYDKNVSESIYAFGSTDPFVRIQPKKMNKN